VIDNDRQHVRIPLALEVEYRTAGAFLVAYSVNLSKGGIYLETDNPMPMGTVLNLRFSVPGGDPLEVTGVVAWVRGVPEPGKPAGMGIEFENLDGRHGEVIDGIVAAFRGIRVVVLAKSSQTRSVLARGVRSLFATADIVETSDSDLVEAAVRQKEPDLIVVDLDDSEADGLLALRLAKTLLARPVPVIVASHDDDVRIRARELGADDVLNAPVTLPDMQAAVVRAISRPVRVA
jgi:type IV pilus assembly protein PilZ